MKVLIAAGGTGGHIIPALAVASKLSELGHSIKWVGTTKGLESTLVSNNNFEINYIDVYGLRGKNIISKFKSLFYFIKSLIQSIKIIQAEKPNLIIGMGGFVSAPVGIAAWILDRPLVIHEQNSIMGTTNKILSILAKKTLTGFPKDYIKITSDKVFFTGNPIRSCFSNLPPVEQRFNLRPDSSLNILILGGSQGSLALNQKLPDIFYQLIQKSQINLNIIHQAGNGKQLECEAIYQELKLNVSVVPFIEDMSSKYAWSDLVICRSGALTIAEITAAGIASVLVPLPNAIDDHQYWNAKYLECNNATKIIPQRTLGVHTLGEFIKECYYNREKIVNLAKSAHKLATLKATDLVVYNCLEVTAI